MHKYICRSLFLFCFECSFHFSFLPHVPLLEGLAKVPFQSLFRNGGRKQNKYIFSTAYVEEVGVWPLQEANTRGNIATAIQALPAETVSSAEPGFQYWKIRDYANAYSTGSVTPLEVRASSKSRIHPDHTWGKPEHFCPHRFYHNSGLISKS
jgi:hypothetical protein